MFVDQDEHASGELERRGALAVTWGTLFNKGVTIGLGRDHDERYNRRLRDLIIAGVARPSAIVTQRLPIDDAPSAYRELDARNDGYMKIVLSPA